MVLHLKKEQENAEWLKRANVNMMVDNKKFVTYKEVKEELKNSADKDIMEFYGELVFRERRGGDDSENEIRALGKEMRLKRKYEKLMSSKLTLVTPMDRPKPTVLPKSLDEDELPVTEEDMNLYNQVNRNYSSRLHEIKKEEISEDEKVRKKLVG
ncbi:hypothetical protein RhiirA5_429592 [Rhizophagus irregularis]|uniref:Uncharacterized protein n=1 Tax=Rhizophagus irregularis TaxID=588596 RepID=A0A2N0NY48_9GLOM|nr:hypothetical protein RhiirA5_429592 [Rhizophagus irregularis]